MFEQQITRGVALLNIKAPGWAQKVDVRRLDMGEGVFYQTNAASCGCVCAQLHGRYFKAGLRALGLPSTFEAHSTIAEYGFIAGNENYVQLTREWRAVIATAQGYRGPR